MNGHKIDPWFLNQFQKFIQFEAHVKKTTGQKPTPELLL